MRNLVFGSSFKRTYKSVVRRQPLLKPKIQNTLKLLATDPFAPTLRTHKLKGRLAGSWSCTVEYNCRIVFDFVENPIDEQQEILLIDIGTHDEVY